LPGNDAGGASWTATVLSWESRRRRGIVSATPFGDGTGMAAHRHATLLVEDDPDTRDAVAMLLELHEYDVYLAADGQHALDVLRAGVRPCLILLDVNMPRMDGGAFRRAQTADPALRDIPVVLLTGQPRLRSMPEPLASLATYQKPVDPERLLALVGEHCPMNRRGLPPQR
jgi:two-component system chemotaxis response regulator CheY